MHTVKTMMNRIETGYCKDDEYFPYFVIVLVISFLIVSMYTIKIENLLLQINSMETRHDMDSEIAEEKLDSLYEEYDVLNEKYNELKEKTAQILLCVDQIHKNVEDDE